jgi:pyruvate-ferredoxin/flavodoxin oxidoreductase
MVATIQGRRTKLMDGNEAAASVAYRASEVIAIYPITPSSTMGELADEWASQSKVNLWGFVPSHEMQSEGGAAGAVHGALQAARWRRPSPRRRALLLMIPNMYQDRRRTHAVRDARHGPGAGDACPVDLWRPI